jgi:5-methylcytosine-specific restriction endonuclease McrA
VPTLPDAPPVSAFRPFPRNRDGLNSWCRACTNARSSERKRARTAERRGPPLPEGHKRCPRCSVVKPLDAFHRNAARTDGHDPYCAPCALARRGHTGRQPDPAPSGHRTCTTCSEVKPHAAFYADAHRGVSASCRACRLARDGRQRRERGVPANPRFDDPPGYKTCRRCRATKVVARFSTEPRNRDGLNSWCTACVRERTLLWHRTNPMAMQRLKALRRTAENAGTITEADWLSLLDRHRHRCAYCGGAGPLSVEHVIPVTRGGRHTLGNIVPVCKPCNSSKGARLLSEWRYQTRRRPLAGMPSVLALRFRHAGAHRLR